MPSRDPYLEAHEKATSFLEGVMEELEHFEASIETKMSTLRLEVDWLPHQEAIEELKNDGEELYESDQLRLHRYEEEQENLNKLSNILSGAFAGEKGSNAVNRLFKLMKKRVREAQTQMSIQ